MKIKTILITASTSEMGLGVLKAFAKEGHNIIFNGIESNGLEIAEAVASEYNINYKFSSANILQPRALYDMVTAATEKFEVQVFNHVYFIEEYPAEK